MTDPDTDALIAHCERHGGHLVPLPSMTTFVRYWLGLRVRAAIAALHRPKTEE